MGYWCVCRGGGSWGVVLRAFLPVCLRGTLPASHHYHHHVHQELCDLISPLCLDRNRSSATMEGEIWAQSLRTNAWSSTSFPAHHPACPLAFIRCIYSSWSVSYLYPNILYTLLFNYEWAGFLHIYIYFYPMKSFTLMPLNCLPWQTRHPSRPLLSPLAQRINHPAGNKCQAVIIDAFMEIDYLFERHRESSDIWPMAISLNSHQLLRKTKTVIGFFY